MQDAFSKWVEVVPVTDKTAEPAVQGHLNDWIHWLGTMKISVSDQGKETVNTIISSICKQPGEAQQRGNALHCQSNSLVLVDLSRTLSQIQSK